MKVSLRAIICLVTIMNLVSVMTTTSQQGIPPWESNFDTTNSLLEWKTSHGNVTIENGYVRGTDCTDLGNSCAISMWKNASEVTGEWRLDYFLNSTGLVFGIYFYFIGNGIVESNDADNGLHPRFAYGIYVGKKGHISLFYQPDANTKWPVWLAANNTEDPDGWSRYTIMRDSSGHMQVFRNEIPKLEATDNNLTSSEYVNFIMEMNGRVDFVGYTDPNYVPPVTTNSTTPDLTDTDTMTPDTSNSNTNNSSFHIPFEGIGILWMIQVIRRKFKR